MQMAETGHGTVGGPTAQIGGEEAKTPEILRRTIEVPSKILRNITLTSRLPHASRTLAAGWACRSRTVGAWGIGGVETLA